MRSLLALVLFVLGSHAAGALGALATDAELYRAIERPWWAPPGWLFAPVWLTLYTMMGIAAWLVWRTARVPARSRALAWFGVQLALNALWTPVFFGIPSLGGGLVVIIALWIAIVATIGAFERRSRLAALLLVPYLAWVSFATLLNATLWWIN